MRKLEHRVIDKFQWADRVQLRFFYFNQSNELIIGRYNRTQGKTTEEINLKMHEIVEAFFNDLLSNVLGL